MAKITLWGILNNYPEIIKGVELPNNVDYETLLEVIIFKAGENEVMHPNPVFMEIAVRAWFRAKKYEFDKLAETLDLEYNPIENYDRKEEWTDRTESTSNSSTKGNGTSMESKYAFDSTSFNPYTRTESTNNDTDTVRGNGETVHSGKIHGNIGVTTSQQMIQSEREVANFDIYDYIANKFEDAFTLAVY